MIELTTENLKYYRRIKQIRPEYRKLMTQDPTSASILAAGDAWLDWLREYDPWSHAAAVRYYVKGYSWHQIALWRGSGTPDAVRVELVARRNRFNRMNKKQS